MSASIGPLIFDLQGTEISAEEREILQHPLIGGVIFFARNYESPEQITQLCQNIRKSRKTPILITVDQEGGRIQRFRTGFTRLPSMGQIGAVYQDSAEVGLRFAHTCGWLMAAELLSVGVDLSYAPVLDLDKEMNTVIGDRAFSGDTSSLIKLALAFTQGMREAGMAAVGKHFPGHGSVAADSHLTLPVDSRSLSEIVADDMVPFIEMARHGMEGIMASHILFPEVDSMPASLSRRWLRDILRKQFQFQGMIMSDCLSMNGADIGGDFPERAQLSLEAGCDMVLICNQRENVIKTLDGLPKHYQMVDSHLVDRLRGQFEKTPQPLKDSPLWQQKYNAFIGLISANQVVV